jgi:hypothetical protein
MILVEIIKDFWNVFKQGLKDGIRSTKYNPYKEQMETGRKINYYLENVLGLMKKELSLTQQGRRPDKFKKNLAYYSDLQTHLKKLSKKHTQYLGRYDQFNDLFRQLKKYGSELK